MTAQAIVERGMLDGLAGGVTRIKYAIETRLGEGNAKWLLVACMIALLFWAFRPRR
jgi:hypothetical protein